MVEGRSETRDIRGSIPGYMQICAETKLLLSGPPPPPPFFFFLCAFRLTNASGSMYNV